MDITLERYSPDMAGEWDRFVAGSRNATFLMQRGYMDYHSHRFTDCSWIARKNGKIAALLPANITEDGVLQTHGGLTYGGWVLPEAHIDGNDLLEIFGQGIATWRREGIKALDYKPLPGIYALRPSEEDLYALWRLGAQQTECGLSSAIRLGEPLRFNQMQRRHLKRASSLQVVCEETTDIPDFMNMVEHCLADRHEVAPVHSAAEMALLKSRFPDRIRFFVAKLEGKIHAGMCIYDCGTVAHAQYIATTPEGRSQNLLSLLVNWLAGSLYQHCRYFDFGISTEDHGRWLNAGLVRQKCSYGATGVAYTRWHLAF